MMSETPRPLTVLTPSGTSPPTGKVSPPPLGPPSRPPVRVRVGGGYVYHHDTRKIETASTEEASSSDLRAALAEKDSKILRLQTRLAGMKEKLSELESVMKVAEEEHASEISGMHARAEAAETAKRLALQEQEKAQHGLENLQMQQQAMFAQQRHQLDDAMAAGWKDGFHANANGVAQAQVETALADAQKRLADGERQRVQVAEELARSERQRVHELQTASAVQDDLRHRCHQWQSQAERAERALADSQVQCEALREALREAVVRNNGSSSSGSAGVPALIGPPTCAHDDAPFAAACASARDGARAAPRSDGQVPMAPMMSPAAAMLSPDLLDAFEAATAALSEASPGKQLFLRVAALDPSLTSLELSHDPEIGRWPLERQAAALALLQGSPHVTKLNLSGLNLTDAVAPALRGVLEAPTGRLEVLSLEQNDFREAGLLELVEGLRTNTALRELRLDGQKMPTSKRVEEALAAALDGAGATGLCKLGLTIRNDAARRSVDASLFRATERARLTRLESAAIRAPSLPRTASVFDPSVPAAASGRSPPRPPSPPTRPMTATVSGAEGSSSSSSSSSCCSGSAEPKSTEPKSAEPKSAEPKSTSVEALLEEREQLLDALRARRIACDEMHATLSSLLGMQPAGPPPPAASYCAHSPSASAASAPSVSSSVGSCWAKAAAATRAAPLGFSAIVTAATATPRTIDPFDDGGMRKPLTWCTPASPSAAMQAGLMHAVHQREAAELPPAEAPPVERAPPQAPDLLSLDIVSGEHLAAVASFTQRQQALAAKAFRRIDRDGDGELTLEELLAACRADKSIRKLLGLPEPQPTSGLDDGIIDPFEAFFMSLDTDGSNSLSESTRPATEDYPLITLLLWRARSRASSRPTVFNCLPSHYAPPQASTSSRASSRPRSYASSPRSPPTSRWEISTSSSLMRIYSRSWTERLLLWRPRRRRRRRRRRYHRRPSPPHRSRQSRSRLRVSTCRPPRRRHHPRRRRRRRPRALSLAPRGRTWTLCVSSSSPGRRRRSSSRYPDWISIWR